MRFLRAAVWIFLPIGALTCLAQSVALSASQMPVQKNAPDDSIKTQFHQALSLAKQGKNPQALALVSELLRAHPGFAAGWKLQGMLLEESGRAEAAAQAFRKWLEL